MTPKGTKNDEGVESLRKKYIETLIAFVESAEGAPDPAILDRIERLLGEAASSLPAPLPAPPPETD